jgi:hypothetical protein
MVLVQITFSTSPVYWISRYVQRALTNEFCVIATDYCIYTAQ